VVLADGEVVRANASQNEDLFWALRGGGGNFGIVTEFTFRVHPVGTVIAGPTFWDVSQAEDVLRAYRDFMRTAPRELNGFFLFASVPPGEPFPPELHFHKVCGVLWCYVGDEAAAAAAMQPLLDATPEPLLHGPGPMPHAVIQGAFDGVYPKGDQWYWRAEFFNEITDEAIAIHAKYGAAMPTWKSTMHMYPIDGAVHDVGNDATAWGYRDANFSAVFAGVDPDPANAEAIKAWAVEYNEALKPYGSGGAYLNMIMDEGPERVRASFKGNYDKLARVKAEYDPSNLFRVNQNIAPANN
jgi:FAD/FMN-containing dehydrogenase